MSLKKFLQGIKNIIVFFPVVWKFRNWDYAYTLNILGKCFEQMEKEPYIKDKNVTILKNLCERMAGKNINVSYGPEEYSLKSSIDVESHFRDTQDMRLFCILMSKHFFKFWY